MSNKTESNLVDPNKELKELLERQQQLDAQVEGMRKSVIYHKFKGLLDFLEDNNLHIKEFFEIGEKHYQEEFGKKPISTSKDLSFTPAGKRRILPLKYQDTQNKENTWSGRGKQPNWLIERMQQGFKMEDFLIKAKK